jgi:phage/plasmid-associated DNA primase
LPNISVKRPIALPTRKFTLFEYCGIVSGASDVSGIPLLDVGEPIDASAPLRVQLNLKFGCSEHDDPEEIDDPFGDKFILTLIKTCQETMEATYELGSDDDRVLSCVVLKTNGIEIDPVEHTYNMSLKLHFPYCRVDCNTVQQQYLPTLVRSLKLENISNLMTQLPEGDISTWFDHTIYRGHNPLYMSVRDRRESPLYIYCICDFVETEHVSNSEYPDLKFDDIFFPEQSGLVQRGLVSGQLCEEFEEMEGLPILLSMNYWSRLFFPKKKRNNFLAHSLKSNRREEGTETMDSINNNMELARVFINYLGPERANKRHYWMDVGKALYNCDQGEDRGLEMWMDFTRRRSRNFTPEDCEDIYDSLDTENYFSVKTLAWFAKQDSPKQYLEWHKKWLLEAMDRSLSLSHTDMANALYRCYWLTYTCASLKDKIWFKFNGTTWLELDGGDKLRSSLSYGFKNKFERYRASISQQVAQTDDPNFKLTAEAKIQKIGSMITRLTNVTPKNMIMTEAMEHFKDDNFLKVADRNPNYMGLRNRIIETTSTSAIVRNGKPEDYITLFVEINWRDNMNENSSAVKRFTSWMRQMFPDVDLREYVMRLISSCLQSRNKEKIFPVFTGLGDNGKSMFKKLVDAIFGPYSFTFPTEIVTEKPHGRGNASPELALAEFAKIAWLVEPDDDDSIRNGQLKKLTGGDKMFARRLHSNGGAFIPMYTLFMMCNKIPTIPGADKATMNRFRSVPCLSTWSDEAPDSLEEQREQCMFKVDKNFEDLIPAMAPGALWFFVENYSEYARKGLREPEMVTEHTRDYWENNDIYRIFERESIENVVNEKGIRDKDVSLNLEAIYQRFSEWFERNYPRQSCPERPSVKYELEQKFRWGPMIEHLWHGRRFKSAITTV